MSFALRNRAIVLIFAEVLLICTSAFWNDDTINSTRITLFYTGFFFLGGYAMSQSMRWLKVYAFLILGSIIVGRIDLGMTSFVLRVIFNSAAYLFLFKVVLHYSFFRRNVFKSDRLLAGVAGYILLGLFWANFFMFIGSTATETSISSVDPVSGEVVTRVEKYIPILNQVSGEATTRAEELYYSFVTITSLGYGDIVPVSPMAKVVATFAGLSGVLYTAIFISALISSLRDKE